MWDQYFYLAVFLGGTPPKLALLEDCPAPASGTKSGVFSSYCPNVLHAATSPLLNPASNHFTRSAELPWVNESGLTLRPAMRCRRSSPMADAALSALLTSPASRILRCSVEWPQTPARQSACSSSPTES